MSGSRATAYLTPTTNFFNGPSNPALTTDLDEPVDEPEPQAAPRPEGAYPRSVEHQERVKYSYGPSTGEFAARVVSSSEPVVTGWDYSPPQQDEREVGSWDVTPTEDGVTAANQGHVEIPESVKDRLRAEASETGEPVTTSTTLRYQHDLDTRETQSRAPRLSAAALAERARSRKQQNGELDPRYKKILDQLNKQQQQRARGWPFGSAASACVTTRGTRSRRSWWCRRPHPCVAWGVVKDGTNHRWPGPHQTRARRIGDVCRERKPAIYI